MSDPLVDELYTRMSILLEADDPCATMTDYGNILFEVGPDTTLVFEPGKHVEILHKHRAALVEAGSVDPHDRPTLEEALKGVRRQMVLYDLAGCK